MPAPHSQTYDFSNEQIAKLHSILIEQGWQMDSLPHARWRARRGKASVVAYNSGKTVLQGKEIAELIEFIIEPQITGEARFGYEEVWLKEQDPAMFTPHAGIDESGKGDFFGPLVVACAFTDENTANALLEAGIKDSKKITSDRKAMQLAAEIRRILNGRFSLVTLPPETYNRLYNDIGNLNRLLAWAHARALENLLQDNPQCPRAISDQFAASETLRRALMERGKNIEFQTRTKAESDIAVAAASLLARDGFLRGLEKLQNETGCNLPKGAGPTVKSAGIILVEKYGAEILNKTAKTHFRTSEEIIQCLKK